MKIPNTKDQGQALIECIGFVCALAVLLSTMASFSRWFLIHQRLLIAAREGALLYSSGHMESAEVKRRLNQFLSTGTPALDPGRLTFYVGQSKVPQAHAFSLDEIRVQYRPHSPWIGRLQPVMEERCTIKHAPHYGPPYQRRWGPPIHW